MASDMTPKSKACEAQSRKAKNQGRYPDQDKGRRGRIDGGNATEILDKVEAVILNNDI